MRGNTEYAIERMCTEVAQIRMLMEGGVRKPACDFCRVGLNKPETFTVIAHNGRQMQVTWNFCPVCGRKLERL